MLEVVNLKKIYKTKKGQDVHALDGVSLRFPEKGMVFLLGKSGSGKSTLLNICGGLDNATSGEIIVKGRSSKDFSQSDFDSYRNTFIGFIFQEYNILNEFSVEDNIALALELQGKPKDKKAVADLLREVDLNGFAKRKPNTLSGGQKQRIAIARALVKSPEIIMADEPTGALDSNTGRQVLETLKKLSKEKLVIVVSHDREFAEQYGDRIIELMDGKVISDVSKATVSQEKLTENIDTVGDVLCIKNGNELTDGDFEKIKSFLKNSKKDIIIAKDEKDVKAFKKASRITESGSREVFKDTGEDNDKKQYTKEDSRFIRSKLPVRHALKIGVSSLKTKPIRLFFTIILCTVAFTLLGFLSTLNFYDSEATFKQTLSDITLSNVQLQKVYKYDSIFYYMGEKENEYESTSPAKLNADEIKEISEKYGKDAFGAVSSYTNLNLKINNSRYWQNQIKSFALLTPDNSLYQKINGSYPKTKNEAVITLYTANMLMECQGLDSKGNLLSLNRPEDIIGKSISLNGEEFKITGIIDMGDIPAEFEVLKTADDDDYNALQGKLSDFIQNSLHPIVFVNEEAISILSENETYSIESILDYTRIVTALKKNGKYDIPKYPNASYQRMSDLDKKDKILGINKNANAPADNEVLISYTYFAELVSESYQALIDKAAENEDFVLMDKYQKTLDTVYPIIDGGIYSGKKEDNNKFTPFTEAELENRLNTLITAVKRDKINLQLAAQVCDEENQTLLGDKTEFSVAGVIIHKKLQSNTLLTLNENAFNKLWDFQKNYITFYYDSKTDYTEPENAIFTAVYVPFEYSENLANDYWDVYQSTVFDSNSSRLKITSSFVYDLEMVDMVVDSLSKVFLYVGLVFAIFAALLLSNFISVSISQKKREIGILRAVGARSLDVFKIFFSESFVITLICILLSTAASVSICSLINSLLAEYIGASLLVFGILSFIILVGIALLTAVTATFLPVYNAARKKPVDSIRSL